MHLQATTAIIHSLFSDEHCEITLTILWLAAHSQTQLYFKTLEHNSLCGNLLFAWKFLIPTSLFSKYFYYKQASCKNLSFMQAYTASETRATSFTAAENEFLENVTSITKQSPAKRFSSGKLMKIPMTSPVE